MLEEGNMDVVMTYHDLLITMCLENYHELNLSLAHWNFY